MRVIAGADGHPVAVLEYAVRLEPGAESQWTIATVVEVETGAATALKNLNDWLPLGRSLLTARQSFSARLLAASPRMPPEADDAQPALAASEPTSGGRSSLVVIDSTPQLLDQCRAGRAIRLLVVGRHGMHARPVAGVRGFGSALGRQAVMSKTGYCDDTTQDQPSRPGRSGRGTSSKVTPTAGTTSSRANALARLARTALGSPSTQERRAEPEPADRSLTVREQSLFRATTRRALRAATVLGGITLAALTPLMAIGMMLMVPERQLLLVAIFGIEGVISLGVTVLALGRWRLPPLPLAFALAFSLPVNMSCLLAFVPEIRTPSLMLLALLPSAVALLAPWGVRVQAGWLLAAGAPVLAVITVASASGAVQADEWFGAGMVLGISALVSLAGSLGTAGMRRRAFEHRMEARSAHVATLAREAELERLNGELALATRTDPLTGLGNRRRLDEELTAAAARATRYGNDCAMALLDVDGFKTYNDSLGHVAGDAALRAVAAALLASVRATDTVCRFGGDEFVVLMPEQPCDGAARVVERIRRAVEDLQLGYPTPSGPQVLTISAGIALLGRSESHDGDEVLRQADAELYRAKGAGRKTG